MRNGGPGTDPVGPSTRLGTLSAGLGSLQDQLNTLFNYLENLRSDMKSIEERLVVLEKASKENNGLEYYEFNAPDEVFSSDSIGDSTGEPRPGRSENYDDPDDYDFM